MKQFFKFAILKNIHKVINDERTVSEIIRIPIGYIPEPFTENYVKGSGVIIIDLSQSSVKLVGISNKNNEEELVSRIDNKSENMSAWKRIGLCLIEDDAQEVIDFMFDNGMFNTIRFINSK
jgi:predicted phosphoadenosine phosphosulfate sulfurtransferase